MLILDEATSSLDDAAANAIGETINALRGQVTILMIAHALPASVRDVQAFPIDGRSAG